MARSQRLLSVVPSWRTVPWAQSTSTPHRCSAGWVRRVGRAARFGSLPKMAPSTCETVGGTGDITGVIAGTGLTGGATAGDATLNVSFAGSGGGYLGGAK